MSSVSIPVLLTVGTPQQKIVNFYTNNRTEPNEDGPPVQIGKRWNTRLVVDHLFHDEIEKEVNELKPKPEDWIGVWQSTVTTIKNRLEAEGKLPEYQAIADQWNKVGPPKEIQMR